jgi:hypothetical protein
MPRHYQYIKINNYCFCLQQNVVEFTWILFFKRDEMISTFQGWMKKTHHPHRWELKHYVKLFLANFKTLMLFLLYRLNLRKTDEVLNLPVYGHFCMSIHRGHKIFDLRRRVVAKVFDADVDRLSISNEVELMKKISQINYAPVLRRSNIDEKWYEEDYFQGSINPLHTSMDSTVILSVFKDEIIPCLKSLISFRNPAKVKSLEYLEKIIETAGVNRVFAQEFEVHDIEKIRNFLHSINERLSTRGNSLVYLIFSHGDFCPANIINTSLGIRIIDWESAVNRSMMFDFYSYFFFRPACMGFSVDRLVTEIHEAVQIYLSGLEQDIYENVSQLEDVYRWFYYIECVCKLIERGMTDKRLDIMNFILRYMEAFKEYERIKAERFASGKIKKNILRIVYE